MNTQTIDIAVAEAERFLKRVEELKAEKERERIEQAKRAERKSLKVRGTTKPKGPELEVIKPRVFADLLPKKTR